VGERERERERESERERGREMKPERERYIVEINKRTHRHSETNVYRDKKDTQTHNRSTNRGRETNRYRPHAQHADRP
jgi:hypothetical protein